MQSVTARVRKDFSVLLALITSHRNEDTDGIEKDLQIRGVVILLLNERYSHFERLRESPTAWSLDATVENRQREPFF